MIRSVIVLLTLILFAILSQLLSTPECPSVEIVIHPLFAPSRCNTGTVLNNFDPPHAAKWLTRSDSITNNDDKMILLMKVYGNNDYRFYRLSPGQTSIIYVNQGGLGYAIWVEPVFENVSLYYWRQNTPKRIP